MRRIVIAVMFIAAVLAVAPGCSMNMHRITPTPQVIKQIGLPRYPNARPVIAMTILQKTGPTNMQGLVASFMTDDDIARITAFYAKALPRATRTTLPFGGGVSFDIQEPSKNGPGVARSVRITPGKTGAMIQLTRMIMTMPTPAPTSSP